jgi:hypothetical protein
VRAFPTLAVLAALASCAPSATVRPTVSDGEATFAWEGDADAVFLVGTPTGWTRVPLAREGRRFTVRVPVAPGRHEYRLEIEAGGAVRTFLPDGAERVEDGFGGENAILRVGGT